MDCVPFPKPGEKRKGQAALRELPPSVRRYFTIHYYIGMSDYEKRYGEFVGLVCTSCNRWHEFGHKEVCAVGDMEWRADKARERALAKRKMEAPHAP